MWKRVLELELMDVLSWYQRGAVSELQSELINARRYPYYNSALNLSISKSCNLQAVRNVIGTTKEIIPFFNASAKRNYLFISNLPTSWSVWN